MKLINDDCLRVLTLADNSVDLILTDPPYGTTQNKWDSVIPLDKMWVEIKKNFKKKYRYSYIFSKSLDLYISFK